MAVPCCTDRASELHGGLKALESDLGLEPEATATHPDWTTNIADATQTTVSASRFRGRPELLRKKSGQVLDRVAPETARTGLPVAFPCWQSDSAGAPPESACGDREWSTDVPQLRFLVARPPHAFAPGRDAPGPQPPCPRMRASSTETRHRGKRRRSRLPSNTGYQVPPR